MIGMNKKKMELKSIITRIIDDEVGGACCDVCLEWNAILFIQCIAGANACLLSFGGAPALVSGIERIWAIADPMRAYLGNVFAIMAGGR